VSQVAAHCSVTIVLGSGHATSNPRSHTFSAAECLFHARSTHLHLRLPLHLPQKDRDASETLPNSRYLPPDETSAETELYLIRSEHPAWMYNISKVVRHVNDYGRWNISNVFGDLVIFLPIRGSSRAPVRIADYYMAKQCALQQPHSINNNCGNKNHMDILVPSS
jgi:hypothetical protein